MGANDTQVGGDHYKASSFQPWDIDRYWVGLLEHGVIKYTLRWRKKNGLEDIGKAIHYLEKLLEENKHYGRTNRALTVNTGPAMGMVAAQFLDKNNITNEHERLIISNVIAWSSRDDIEAALDHALALQMELKFVEAKEKVFDEHAELFEKLSKF